MDQLRYMFVIPVWGDAHTRLFLEIFLPSMLAAGNIPYLAKSTDVSCLMFVKDIDEERIRSHSNMQKLSELIKVEYRHINFIKDRANHDILSDCHRDGMREACSQDAYAILPPPDSVWSNNSLTSLHALVMNGIKVIHMACLRLQLELIYPLLIERAANDGGLSIHPRELVGLTMKRLHAITKTHFVNFYAGGLMAANLLWKMKSAGILAHCFHLHPILIKPTESNLDFKVTIDDDLLMGDAYAPEEIYIVQDSDEMLAYEISSRMHYIGTTGEKDDIDSIVKWAYIGTNMVHRELIRTPIYLHHTELNLAEWANCEAEAALFVDTTLVKLNAYVPPQEAKISALYKIWQAYGKLFKLLRSIDTLVLGTTLKLRKSHWMYLLEAKILMPVAKEIINRPGVKCFIDDDRNVMLPYLRSSFDVFTCTYLSRYDLFNDADAFEESSKFDSIICRVNEEDQSIQSVIDKATPYLATNGNIILYCFGDFVPTIPDCKHQVIIIRTAELGGVGCKVALHLHNSFSTVIGLSVKKMMSYNVFGIIAKAILRIMYLPVKVIFYPLFGMALVILEALSTYPQQSKN